MLVSNLSQIRIFVCFRPKITVKTDWKLRIYRLENLCYLRCLCVAWIHCFPRSLLCALMDNADLHSKAVSTSTVCINNQHHNHSRA